MGRHAFVGPAEKDCFFLRLLLANVEALKSYTDLKTVWMVLSMKLFGKHVLSPNLLNKIILLICA